MKNQLLWMVVIILTAMISIGQWHWHSLNTKTLETAKLHLENSTFEWNPYQQFQQSQQSLGDLKEPFLLLFEAAYSEYEQTMNELLFAANEEYHKKALTDANPLNQIVPLYQTAAREAEDAFIEDFWTNYEQLQEKMEEAGYPRDSAFEFELELQLRIEQISHAFIYELMTLGVY